MERKGEGNWSHHHSLVPESANTSSKDDNQTITLSRAKGWLVLGAEYNFIGQSK